MKVIIVANVDQQAEIVSKNTNPAAALVFAQEPPSDGYFDEYDAIFYLLENYADLDIGRCGGKPVFINSVMDTLAQKNMPANVSRLNAWPGFLEREKWEVASGDSSLANGVFKALGWSVIFVKDGPGLIAPRIICMIINEAFFALEEDVSSTDEIDLAMTLGTNYPYGPFAWAKKIGLPHIYHLLKALSVNDARYAVSPLLEKKYSEIVLSQ